MRDFLKKFLQLTALVFLVGFVLGLEHNASKLHWLGALVIVAGIFICAFWDLIKNPNWRRRQYKGYLNW